MKFSALKAEINIVSSSYISHIYNFISEINVMSKIYICF